MLCLQAFLLVLLINILRFLFIWLYIIHVYLAYFQFLIWSGEEKNHMRGVDFLLSKRAKDALLGYNPVNSRNIVARNKTNEIQYTMTTKQTGTHRLGRRPVIQGPRPQLGNRGWVERLATGVEGKGEGEKKLKAATDFLKIGTWNVRTLRSPGKLELLRKEMTPYECDILGLSEMRWTGVGELNGGEVIWSGEEKNHMRGVDFLLSKRAKDALLGYNPVNSRNIVARFNGAPLNIAVIQVYAPTSDSTEEEVETFYGQLEHTIEELPKKDVKIVIGDWNAKVGTDNLGWEQVMGCHGYGQRNNRGERLLEFASKNDLLITNTRFQQKDSRKWTWMAPDGKYTNMIDLVLVNRRWKTAVRVCRTFPGADISSDHSLVMCKLKLRLKRTTRQQLHEPRRNIDALGNATVRAQNKPWITECTLKLAKTKREMKQRRQESEEREKEYRVMCNVVRKPRSGRSGEKVKE
uniref:Endonuclease/exonuclease/phosphatase domain-containing protein n=1 Tax=Sinocyclocheilus grahami TaxID=75366 RepID=A0A672N8W4_SINGR